MHVKLQEGIRHSVSNLVVVFKLHPIMPFRILSGCQCRYDEGGSRNLSYVYFILRAAPGLEEHETHETCRDVSERILTEKKIRNSDDIIGSKFFKSVTPPKFNSSPLKYDSWKTIRLPCGTLWSLFLLCELLNFQQR